MDLLAYDPVTGYGKIYKQQFADEAEAFFDDAVREGGIDPALNEELSAKLRELLEEKNNCSGKKGWWIFLVVIIIAALIIWGICIACNASMQNAGNWTALFAVSALSCTVICWKILPVIKKLSEQEAQLEKACNALYGRIRELLSPLFRFFDWNTVTNLISKVIEPLQFDDYLSVERLADFRENFGFSLVDEPESTLTGAHSGTFYGYPFIFTEDVDFSWGTKVWTGSLSISYREQITTAEGKKEWVTRTQVLTASITKPYPEFTKSRNFFFGHDGAPNLCFSRTPSSLSGGSGFWNSMGKKYQLRQLRKFSQDLTDESQYTMVANHEFEVLFRSENRNDEVEFRLLYTPLAQQYMVKLLNDNSEGFGDDFSCEKNHCVTRICSEHLNETALSEPPFHSDAFDLKEIKALFLERSANFFRSIYFSLAPVMLIPVFNEPRLHDEEESAPRTISPSEIEGAAYSCSRYFSPEESITENIFNVLDWEPLPGGAEAVVESIGFAGVEHVEYVTCFGKDGHFHDVPVCWTEYVPVSRETRIRAWLEGNCPKNFKALFRRRGILFG